MYFKLWKLITACIKCFIRDLSDRNLFLNRHSIEHFNQCKTGYSYSNAQAQVHPTMYLKLMEFVDWIFLSL